MAGQSGEVPQAVIVIDTSSLISGNAAARTTRESAFSPFTFIVGVARIVGTIADEAGVFAHGSFGVPLALRVGGTDGVAHVLTLEATGRELTNPVAELTREARFSIVVEVAAGVAELAVLIPLTFRVSIAGSLSGVAELTSLRARGVGGEASFIARASFEGNLGADRLALHEDRIPLAVGARTTAVLIERSTTNSTRASSTGGAADGGGSIAVASDASTAGGAISAGASRPFAASSSGTVCLGLERAVVLAETISPHAVTIGEAGAAGEGFSALLFAAGGVGLPDTARVEGAGSRSLVGDRALLLAS